MVTYAEADEIWLLKQIVLTKLVLSYCYLTIDKININLNFIANKLNFGINKRNKKNHFYFSFSFSIYFYLN